MKVLRGHAVSVFVLIGPWVQWCTMLKMAMVMEAERINARGSADGHLLGLVINRVEGVLESSVVGIPDEKWGERVVAAVVRKPGSRLKSHEIQGFCKQHLHNWKCPKEIVFLEELPKNRMGKVLKEEVKRYFSGLNTKNP